MAHHDKSSDEFRTNDDSSIMSPSDKEKVQGSHFFNILHHDFDLIRNDLKRFTLLLLMLHLACQMLLTK